MRSRFRKATFLLAVPGLLALVVFVFFTPWERDWMGYTGHAPTLSAVIANPRSALGYWWARNPDDDPRLYCEMASLTLGRGADLRYLASKRGRDAEVRGEDGTARVPYRDFAFEYPPLALVAMLPVRLLAADVPSYFRAFGAQMALVIVALFVSLWRLLRRTLDDPELAAPWAAAAFSLYVLSSGGIVVNRFDGIVALFTVLALLAAVDERFVLAGVLLGLGAGTKLWPVLLVPLVMLAALRYRSIGASISVGIAAAVAFLGVHAILVPAAGRHVFDYLGYHGARGVQLESIHSSVLLLAHHLGIVRARVGFAFGSAEIDAGAASRAAVLLSYPIMLAALGGSYVLAARAIWRGDRGTRARARILVGGATTIVTALLVTAKVLSPQYLIWLAPIAFAWGTPRARWVAASYVAACVLTQALFPRQYAFLLWMAPRGTALLVARNACLVAMTVLSARALLAIESPARVTSGTGRSGSST